MMAAIEADHARTAAQLLRARRNRDALFGEDRAGFGEPGWDMLLALFVSDAAARPMRWNTVIDEAGTAPVVAARYLEWLVSRELAERTEDGVRLSARGRELMTRYLEGGEA